MESARNATSCSSRAASMGGIDKRGGEHLIAQAVGGDPSEEDVHFEGARLAAERCPIATADRRRFGTRCVAHARDDDRHVIILRIWYS
jgi:hypothetical protein